MTFVWYNCIKKKELQIQIVASNSIISNLKSASFLGLTIDSTLSWKDHIAGLTPKLNNAVTRLEQLNPL